MAFRQIRRSAAHFLLKMLMAPEATTTTDTRWREWLAAWGPKLLLYARHQSRNEADAQDALQEGLVRLWRHHRDPESVPPGFAFRLVRQAGIDLARRDLRRRRREEVVAPAEPVEAFACPLAEQERARELADALARIPAPQREILALKVWGELTFEQVAATLDIPPPTAASRYRAALESLRRLLQPDPA